MTTATSIDALPRTFENIQGHILDQIRSGKVKPGDRLQPERELASSLGVGRSAVREALRSLEMSGVLRFKRGAGGGAINYVVAKPSDTFEAGGDIGYGRFNTIEGNAYISGPLGDNVGARLAVTGNRPEFG
jgi:DNA-binding transcriptional MocR family regulator